MKDFDQVKARALVADYQAGRIAEIVDTLQAFLRQDAPSMPARLRGMVEGLVGHGESVSREFAAVNAVHEGLVAKAEQERAEAAAKEALAA